jgi:hypothetical protein
MRIFFLLLKNFVMFFLVASFTGCTQMVTTPIAVTGAVAEAGIHMVGAAGGAVVDTVTGGGDDEAD